mmetsp:Transcript_38242/g.86024  ORF Transcript_38242/g.86024 Transcript_38242/m.86024 type:complete len:189 (+) Transcript_38242:109-675(+)
MGKKGLKITSDVVFPGSLGQDGIDDEVAKQLGLKQDAKGRVDSASLDDPNALRDTQRQSAKSLRKDELSEFYAAQSQLHDAMDNRALARVPDPVLSSAGKAQPQKRKTASAALLRVRGNSSGELVAAADGATRQETDEPEAKSAKLASTQEASGTEQAAAGGGLGLGGYASSDDDDANEESEEEDEGT